MSRDIDKEKKDQRKAECKALRDARKRGLLKTVMSTSNIEEAAKLEHMTPADLKQTLRSYGVKHERGQIWRHAVKDYMDAGMPHQYELRLHSISDDKEVDWFDDETFEKPWSWVDETELEEQLEVDIKKKDWDIQVVPVDKPRYLNFEEKDLQMEFKTLQMEFKLEQEIKARNSDFETKLEQKLEEAVREGYDEAELVVPDPAHPNRTIKYTLPL
ncbi:hypothetical protein N9033_01040 [bacterium]|nr:hypothetical protein [bacterium]